MGRELEINSELGQGTTVSFYIPVQLTNAESAEGAFEISQRAVSLAPNQPLYRILIVDDQPEVRRLLTVLLGRMGFAVREAGNGEEAIAPWQEWEPHLISMDMRMPVMGGRDATRRIKATSKGKKPIIIGLTASSFEDEREQIIQAGCDDFLRKPFQEHELFELIRKHLGVQFIYQALSSSTKKPSIELNFSNIPLALMEQLKIALKQLDDEGIEKTIAEIQGFDADIAQQLSALVASYEHRRIITLIENARDAQNKK